MMKLYYDPISTTSRPVTLFAAEHGVELDLEYVDLMSGQNLEPAYLAVNPSGIVPFLTDGDFSLGESSAILKYLADKVSSPAYPTGLQARARVNAAMDWFSTNLHKDFCGAICYPQLGVYQYEPHVLQAVVEGGRQRSPRWLTVLDQQMLGPNAYICGDDISLADYLGSAFITLGELVDFDFSPYPNIQRWIQRMKALPSWGLAYAAFNGWRSAQSKDLAAVPA